MLKETERNRCALEEQNNLLQIEKKSFDKKYAQLLQKLQKVTKEKDEFEAFTLAHKENPKLWQDKLNEIEQKLKGELASRDKQILELNEQVRDLMFFLEAQKKIDDAEKSEIKDGQVITVAAPLAKATPSSINKRKKK